jgi:galactokinase
MDSNLPGHEIDAHALRVRFLKRFSAEPRLFRAPGRINVIGEHTDYSEGLALPAAIDRACMIAAAPNTSGSLRLVSRNLGEDIERSVTVFEKRNNWSDYVAGCAAALQAEGAEPQGWDMMIASNVPLGAGVSSSASLTVAASFAMMSAAERPMPERVRAIAWTAENRFVGMPCGPLDQFASVFGVRDHALLLDCRALAAEPVPLPDGTSFILIDSGVKHKLVDGGYEQRRAECEHATAQLGLKALRDASLRDLERLEGVVRQRARHVITENARVTQMAAALGAGDIATAGRLMEETHKSLAADYAVTCAETDSLAAIANNTAGVLGARQMGGGFGGCVIALVNEASAKDAAAAIAEQYRATWNIGGEWFVCRTSDGAGEICL